MSRCCSDDIMHAHKQASIHPFYLLQEGEAGLDQPHHGDKIDLHAPFVFVEGRPVKRHAAANPLVFGLRVVSVWVETGRRASIRS